MEKIAKNLQLILMVIILISTVIAVGIEINKMFLVMATTFKIVITYFIHCREMINLTCTAITSYLSFKD